LVMSSSVPFTRSSPIPPADHAQLFPDDGGQCEADKTVCDLYGKCLEDGEVPIWGYGGTSPGPLIRVETDLKWRQEAGNPEFIAPISIIRQQNKLPNNCAGGALTGGSLDVDCQDAITSTHHHGMTSLAGFDGWADDVIISGQHKDYVYPDDNGPRTNWYHDHGLHNTGFNVANGLAGMYVLHVHPDHEAGSYGERILPRWDDDACKVSSQMPGNLPGSTGGGAQCYELMIQLGEVRWSNEGGNTAGLEVAEGTCRIDYEIEGNVWKSDVLTVNGLPWPKIKVFSNRLYRLRFLAASITRAYRLTLNGASGCAKMLVVGTDTELLQTPVPVTALDINTAERYQVVVDFRSCAAGSVVIMRNAVDFLNNEDYRFTDRVMKFIVRSGAAEDEHTSGQPLAGCPDIAGKAAVQVQSASASGPEIADVPIAASRDSYPRETERPSTTSTPTKSMPDGLRKVRRSGGVVSNCPAHEDDDCVNAQLTPGKTCLLSPADADLRRHAVHLGLRALRVARGLERDWGTDGSDGVFHSEDELNENRPLRLLVSSVFEPGDQSDPENFASLNECCLPSGGGFVIGDDPSVPQCVTVRTLIFERSGGQWVINGKTWASGRNDQVGRIEAAPTYGCLEVWHIVTGGGGWHHPVHMHLIDAWALGRSDGREDQARRAWRNTGFLPGSGQGIFPYETGSKDVFFVGFNEYLDVAFWPSPNRGNFMFHCHNLIHEDNDMLLSFHVHHEPGDPNAAPGHEGDDPVPTVPDDYPVTMPDGSSWSAHATNDKGEEVIRYNYPKDEHGTQNLGLITASAYMWEYHALHRVVDVCSHPTEAEDAITHVFGQHGHGYAGTHREHDGTFYASGASNQQGDLLLNHNDDPTEPVHEDSNKQQVRSVYVEDHFYPSV